MAAYGAPCRYISRMKRILAPLAAGVLALSLAACGSDSGDDKADQGPVKTAGELIVCSDVPYAPFEYADDASPVKFSGFDIDIIQFIAKDQGLDLTVVPTGFDAIEGGSALKAGSCDLAASAITINDARKKAIDFSDAYFDSVQSLLVPAKSDITSLADTKGKKIGVQGATTGERYANENATGASVVPFQDDQLLFQALKAGTVDAVLQDIGPNSLHAADGAFEIVDTFDTQEQYGFAIAKGNTELVDMVNESLTKMRESGEYDTVHAKYFD